MGYLLNTFVGIEVPALLIAGAFGLAAFGCWVADPEKTAMDRWAIRWKSLIYSVSAAGISLSLVLGFLLNPSYDANDGILLLEPLLLPDSIVEAGTLGDLKVAWFAEGIESHVLIENPYPFPVVASVNAILPDTRNEVYVKWQGHDARFDIIPNHSSSVLHPIAIGTPEKINLGFTKLGWGTCIHVLVSDGQLLRDKKYVSYACNTDTLHLQFVLSAWSIHAPSQSVSCTYDAIFSKEEDAVIKGGCDTGALEEGPKSPPES